MVPGTAGTSASRPLDFPVFESESLDGKASSDGEAFCVFASAPRRDARPTRLGAPASAGADRREGKAVTPERRLGDACRLEGGAPGQGPLRQPPGGRVSQKGPAPIAGGGASRDAAGTTGDRCGVKGEGVQPVTGPTHCLWRRFHLNLNHYLGRIGQAGATTEP